MQLACPEARRLLALEVLKLSALLLMLLDHVNTFLLAGEHRWMWEAGRVVFPVFAYVLGVGLTSDPRRLQALLVRLLLVAVAAQLALWGVIHADVRSPILNVVFTLAAGVLLVCSDVAGRWVRYIGPVLAGLLTWQAEFGFLGAALVWAVWRNDWRWIALVLVGLSLQQGTASPLFAVLAVLLAFRELGQRRVVGYRGLFGVAYVCQAAVFSVLVA